MMKNRFFLVFLVLYMIVEWGISLKIEADDGFVKARGVQLMLNGSPYYANGYNAYWLMYVASDPSQRNKVSSTFQEASNHGLNIARIWAFSDGGYKPLQHSPESYNEDMFLGLDFVISEARKYGTKLVLSLVNNYDNFGGKKQYVDWARSHGQAIKSEDDFFTNPVVKGYYKNHIKSVLTRCNNFTGVAYKDDPTIMAWELMNEIRCSSDESGNTVQAWITEMASYLKSIDGNHLLEAGLEGFYGPSKQESNPSFHVGTDFIANNQIPDIDFATVHSYPDQWLPGSSNEDQISFLDSWLNDHIQDAQNKIQKPVLFAEFGVSKKNVSSDSNIRDQFFNMVYSTIYSSASDGGAAVGGLFWQLLAQGMDSFRDGYEVILDESPSTATLIAQESQKLNQIRKVYPKMRYFKQWNKAREVRSSQWQSGANEGN
ncbi:mannan endo-1,4-beta-mannosidase 7-like [Abrus precatorius]|uniref:mannan endo-1,4-beta-mannosidase n=1 Tax=Abrus precatorius TaxID=3816 RepID=A0A8B8MHX7_ABRPR|nr:mannan endo-1,4-beta-mannosidase 7-like [Abrus precatorius]